MMKMKRERGFTILELVVVDFLCFSAADFIFLQKLNLDAMHRDEQQQGGDQCDVLCA